MMLNAHERKNRHKRLWTPAEDRILWLEWGTSSLPVLAQRLGRTKRAVYWRAVEVLKMTSVPDGFETITAAAKRTGFAPRDLRRVLKMHGAEIIVRSGCGVRSKHGERRYIVNSFEVDEAVRAWCSSERISDAARRHGVPHHTLRQWLARAGHEKPARFQHWRLPSATIDAVVAERLGRRGAA